eukprot:scaffold10189_cov119-Isochrysis_galbana.AAC.1
MAGGELGGINGGALGWWCEWRQFTAAHGNETARGAPRGQAIARIAAVLRARHAAGTPVAAQRLQPAHNRRRAIGGRLHRAWRRLVAGQGRRVVVAHPGVDGGRLVLEQLVQLFCQRAHVQQPRQQSLHAGGSRQHLSVGRPLPPVRPDAKGGIAADGAGVDRAHPRWRRPLAPHPAGRHQSRRPAQQGSSDDRSGGAG